MDKPALRHTLRSQRRTLSEQQRQEAAAELVHHFLLQGFHRDFQEVAGYIPMDAEIDIMPIMSIMGGGDGRLSLPFIEENNQMIFRRWQSAQPLEVGKYNIPAPGKGESVIPQLIILPLLACDVQGVRLGSGGGYYDRTLARPEYSGCTLLGAGYHFQLLPHLPSEPHDVRVHGFLSERGFQQFRRT